MVIIVGGACVAALGEERLMLTLTMKGAVVGLGEHLSGGHSVCMC